MFLWNELILVFGGKQDMTIDYNLNPPGNNLPANIDTWPTCIGFNALFNLSSSFTAGLFSR